MKLFDAPAPVVEVRQDARFINGVKAPEWPIEQHLENQRQLEELMEGAERKREGLRRRFRAHPSAEIATWYPHISLIDRWLLHTTPSEELEAKALHHARLSELNPDNRQYHVTQVARFGRLSGMPSVDILLQFAVNPQGYREKEAHYTQIRGPKLQTI